MDVKLFFEPAANKAAKFALFLSGSGSNARVILQAAAANMLDCQPAAVVTDRPESAAAALAAEFGLPCLILDLRRFYAGHGEERITLDTPRRRELRELWSQEMWEKLQDFEVDFGVLAGFVPLSNITGKIPCLNVHPGDLTVEKSGVRIFAGLHVKPVEHAILLGYKELRSSVILAQPYCGNGKGEMDSGPILGISEPVAIDLQGMSVAQLQKIADSRIPGVVPQDELRRLALMNIDTLKIQGDHRVFPAVIREFARGNYGTCTADGKFCFRSGDGKWLAVKSVVFDAAGKGAPYWL